MSPEKSQGETSRQVELKEFIFPNNHPFDQVLDEMEKALGYCFINPQILSEIKEDENMGTIWHVKISYEARRRFKDIDDMSLEELELEQLARDRMSSEF